MSVSIYGLYCGVCQCMLRGEFKILEVLICDYCGRHWTMTELLLGIECSDWSKK